MAHAPWRCSECGTVNEPVAIWCRTCGRWPSQLELEEGAEEMPTDSEPDAGLASEDSP